MEEARGSVDRGLYTPQGEKQNVGDSTALMALRKARGATKMPKISEACVHGDAAGLNELLQDLAIDVNELDDESMSALHWASAYGEAHIVSELLKDSRINPNIQNKRGSTPLHQATLCGSHDAMRVLLKDSRVKQEVNSCNMWGETALILAATRGDSEAAAILLNEGGADVSIRDKWGKTAQEVAEDHGEDSTANVFKNYVPGQTIIVQQPVKIKQPTATIPTQKRVLSKMLEAPLDETKALKWMQEEDIDINGADFLKWTALHKVAAWEKPTVLQALLAHPNIQPAVRGRDDDTVIHSAASSGAVRCLKILVEDGRIPIDEANKAGQTPLMMAASDGNNDIILILIEKGADPGKTASDGKMAWHLAKRNNLEETAILLWNKMTDSTRTVAEEKQKELSAATGRPAGRVPGKLAANLVATQEAIRKNNVQN